jgi:hypothetical protein
MQLHAAISKRAAVGARGDNFFSELQELSSWLQRYAPDVRVTQVCRGRSLVRLYGLRARAVASSVCNARRERGTAAE